MTSSNDERIKDGRVALEELPTPLLTHVLSYIPDPVGLCRLACTCSDLQRQTNDSELWNRLYNLRWTVSSATNSSSARHLKTKDDYIYRHRIDADVALIIKDLVNDTGGTHESFARACKYGKDAMDICFRISQTHSDASTRAVAQDLSNLLRTTSTLEEFKMLHQNTTFEDEGEKMEEYAIAVSSIFYCDGRTLADMAADSIRLQLDEIADEVRRRCPLERRLALEDVLECFNQVFFEEMNFHGNYEDYYDYRNSLIHSTLERKMGIPLTLAILYKCICRRIGIRTNIIGLPGHVIVQVPDLDRFVDVFDHGSTLTMRDIERIVNGYNFSMRPEFIQPLSPIEVIQRVMNNISNCDNLSPSRNNSSALKRHLCLGALKSLIVETRQEHVTQNILVAFWVSFHFPSAM